MWFLLIKIQKYLFVFKLIIIINIHIPKKGCQFASIIILDKDFVFICILNYDINQ